MNSRLKAVLSYVKIIFGCALFGVGFNLFLAPSGLNAGGITGLSMVLVEWLDFGTVGIVSAVINLPLFAVGGLKIGKKFFIDSLIGMVLVSVFVDLFSFLPKPNTEILLASLYGAVICGFGLGMVFSVGGSTGGSDIIVRLLKLKYQYVPIGIITTMFDACVAVLTGFVFRDVNMALYSGVCIFVTGRVLDAVVYKFDYSKVVLIISKHHAVIAKKIGDDLHRGSTFLEGQGVYSGQETKVILTAVKKQQIAELKELVVEIDPDAFIIVQEAHQVLGDGFARYSKYNL